MTAILKWFRVRYRSIVSSIAFLPAIIAFFFLVLSWLMISFDFSDTGKNFKSQFEVDAPWHKHMIDFDESTTYTIPKSSFSFLESKMTKI